MTDATLNRFLAYGNAAARGAFTPSPPTPASGPSPLYVWYETDTGLMWLYDGSWVSLGTLGGAFVLTGLISPTSLGSDQNNYSPTGLATASLIRLTASTPVNITGLAAPALGGQVILLANIGSNTITLKNASGSSSAANRFALSADYSLAQNKSALIWYDKTSTNWRLIGA